MTRAQAEAMAEKHVRSRKQYAESVARLADAFEAAYDDGVRDESMRWAAGQRNDNQCNPSSQAMSRMISGDACRTWPKIGIKP
jgi:hypothetical protein